MAMSLSEVGGGSSDVATLSEGAGGNANANGFVASGDTAATGLVRAGVGARAGWVGGGRSRSAIGASSVTRGTGGSEASASFAVWVAARTGISLLPSTKLDNHAPSLLRS